MSFYSCTATALRQEIRRRGYEPSGSRETLSEWLHRDDEQRGADATTISHLATDSNTIANTLTSKRTAYGEAINPSMLVGEEVVHWTLNTFFPSLQLYFASGRSCTLACGQQLDARIGLDPVLRYRLEDVAHEEEGRLSSGILPQMRGTGRPAIKIVAAELRQRVSVRVRPVGMGILLGGGIGLEVSEIVGQIHTAVGLQLEGMDGMGFVWARTRASGTSVKEQAPWGNVWAAGLRNDIPLPHVPPGLGKDALQVVQTGSMIKRTTLALPVRNHYGGH